MLNQFYMAVGATLLIGYALVSFNGWEFGDPQRIQAGSDYRTNSSYRTGHSGFHGFWGGK